MMEVIEKKTWFQAEAAAIQGQAGQPEWLKTARAQAWQRFEALGWPTTRNEAWRFTNLRALAKTAFAEAPFVAGDSAIGVALVEQGPVLVFTNGKFRPELSRLQQNASLRIVPFAQALRGTDSEWLERELGYTASGEGDALVSLNEALWKDAVLIELAEGSKQDQPIEIIHYRERTDSAFAIMPRHLVLARAGSAASIVETFVGEAAEVFTNTVTELRLERGAVLHHYFRELSAQSCRHIHTLAARLADAAKFECHALISGCALVRNTVRVIFEGVEAEACVSGLSVAHDSQHHDHHIHVDHTQGHNTSKQFFKGILDDRARAAFTSRVTVRKNAQKTDSHQSYRNLLLSDSARVDTQPQLEIYADDVKCAHGATTGQLDEEALFYMKSRGISPEQARVLLLYAFAHEVIDRMPLESMRRAATDFLLERFAAKSVLGEQP